MKIISNYILAGLLSLSVTPVLQSQVAPEAYELPIVLGSTEADTVQGLGVYSASVSGPLAANSQELRLVASSGGVTRSATVKTGKSRTLGETIQSLDSAFDLFLSRRSWGNDELLLKIGDVRYGGELFLVAESPDILRFDYIQPSGRSSIRFGREEVAEFESLLSAP